MNDPIAKKVSGYAYLGLDKNDVAILLGTKVDQLTDFHREAYEYGAARRRRIIAKCQMQLCKKLNPTMLVWLGKNELEQTGNSLPGEDPEPGVDPAMA